MTQLKTFTTRQDLEKACRRVKPSLSRKLVDKVYTPLSKTNTASNTGAENQLKSLDAGVKICARKFNEWKAKADKLQKQLNQKQDDLIELKREKNALEQMFEGTNGESKKISMLEKEIEKANATSEAKMHYRLQLNFMHLRQRKNVMLIDTHMAELTSNLQAVENEMIKRTRMLGEIESSYTSAHQSYYQMCIDIGVERARREEEIMSKEMEAQNAEKMEDWRARQESSRKDFQDAIHGGNDTERDLKLLKIKEKEKELRVLRRRTEMKTNCQDSTEDIFFNIKRATGVNSLEEMLEKFSDRHDQQKRLDQEKNEAEERLDVATSKLTKSQKAFNSILSHGSGDTEVARSAIGELNEGIEDERTESKSLNSTKSRLDAVLVGLSQGGMGLYQKLLPFHSSLLGGDAPMLLRNVLASDAIGSANDTLEMLKVVQEILSKMLNIVGSIDTVVGAQQCPQKLDEKRDNLSNPNLGENNCRIQAKVSFFDINHSRFICISHRNLVLLGGKLS